MIIYMYDFYLGEYIMLKVKLTSDLLERSKDILSSVTILLSPQQLNIVLNTQFCINNLNILIIFDEVKSSVKTLSIT